MINLKARTWVATCGNAIQRIDLTLPIRGRAPPPLLSGEGAAYAGARRIVSFAPMHAAPSAALS
jgi:hypothetical protein